MLAITPAKMTQVADMPRQELSPAWGIGCANPTPLASMPEFHLSREGMDLQEYCVWYKNTLFRSEGSLDVGWSVTQSCFVN